MNQSMISKQFKKRAELGEVVGGGFIILGRDKQTGRLTYRKNCFPFEHGSLNDAEKERQRLANGNSHSTFHIFTEI